jgi:hypothetical protein
VISPEHAEIRMLDIGRCYKVFVMDKTSENGSWVDDASAKASWSNYVDIWST